MEPIKPKGGRVMGDFVAPKPRPKATVQPYAQQVRHEASPMQPANPVIKQARKRFHTLKLWWFDSWQPLLIGLSVALVVSTVLGFRIGSLTQGVSEPEKQYVSSITSGQELLKHPSFMPHKLPTYILFKLGVTRPAAYRAVSATLAIGAVVSCFFILRRWYSLRVAILGSWLVLTSAWLLHYARLAVPESSFLLLMPLLWAAVWMYNTPKRRLAIVVLLVASIVSFYIPSFCWLIIGGIIWQRKIILEQFADTEWWFRVLAGLLTMTLLAPLLYAVIVNHGELLLISGLPNSLPKASEILRNLINIPMHLFLQGPNNPVTWLARIPLLDMFSAVMLLLGIYSLRYHILLIRSQLVVATSVILIFFTLSGGLVTMLALLPLIYLLIVGGIAFMLRQWFVIFPRNPVARGVGTTIMSIVVAMVSFYHINHYFIAWPHAPATRDAFQQTLLK